MHSAMLHGGGGFFSRLDNFPLTPILDALDRANEAAPMVSGNWSEWALSPAASDFSLTSGKAVEVDPGQERAAVVWERDDDSDHVEFYYDFETVGFFLWPQHAQIGIGITAIAGSWHQLYVDVFDGHLMAGIQDDGTAAIVAANQLSAGPPSIIPTGIGARRIGKYAETWARIHGKWTCVARGMIDSDDTGLNAVVWLTGVIAAGKFDNFGGGPL